MAACADNPCAHFPMASHGTATGCQFLGAQFCSRCWPGAGAAGAVNVVHLSQVRGMARVCLDSLASFRMCHCLVSRYPVTFVSSPSAELQPSSTLSLHRARSPRVPFCCAVSACSSNHHSYLRQSRQTTAPSGNARLHSPLTSSLETTYSINSSSGSRLTRRDLSSWLSHDGR